MAAAEFEINYSRPSFFGIEAERELSAFVAAFRPPIEDAQMHGMGGGPYSGQGFLDGWNFGNAFSIGTSASRLADFGQMPMPGEALRAAWAWNIECAARRDKYERSAFVPIITFYRIEGRPSRVVVWPLGMPIVLPRVDHVLVGRNIGDEKRYGLATWSEVEDVVRDAGFDMTKDPFDLRYLRTPPAIADWIANLPFVDLATLERRPAYTILDDDLIAAARERFEEGRVSGDES